MSIVKERVLDNSGYFRVRMYLTNGDFLEVAEFFILKGDKYETVEYSYQWMNSTKEKLIKRWDNAQHFPRLENFPHHIHISEENNVAPGVAMNIIELIQTIEMEFSIFP